MTRIASSARIDPKAVVEDGAVIGENAIIGPLSYVGPNAVLGDGVVVMHHASVEGMTRLGPGCQVFPMAVIGGAPQSVRHDASETRLEILVEKGGRRKGVVDLRRVSQVRRGADGAQVVELVAQESGGWQVHTFEAEDELAREEWFVVLTEQVASLR